MDNIPLHLITGFPGAGKTALVRALLAQRPHAEHWALLLNATSTVPDTDGVTVHQLGNDCACCSGRVGFRTALVQLLRATRAQRVLVELPGSADPAGVTLVLREDAIVRAVTLVGTACVVHPRHWADATIAAHEIYLAQLQHATHVVLAESDATPQTTLVAWLSQGTPVTLLRDATPTLLAPSV